MTTCGLKNEDLVILYRETKNEKYLQELITQNTGLLNIIVGSYVASIPNAEREDLISESYIPMLRAIEDFRILQDSLVSLKFLHHIFFS